MRLLLVEDDDRVAGALRDILCRHGFRVHRAANAGAAVATLSSTDSPFDLVIMDLGLPDGDGFELCARIRRTSDMAILIATARADLASRVHGLNVGADDYLVKPYDVRELLARIHAVVRRSSRRQGGAGNEQSSDSSRDESSGAQQESRPRAVTVELPGGVVQISAAGEVRMGGCLVVLTAKEIQLLSLLAESPGVVVRREQILSRVWGGMGLTDGHTLSVHVASLRSKVGDPAIVETVRGIGYRIGGQVR